MAAESLGFALPFCIAKPRKLPRTYATAFQKPKSGKPTSGPATYESIWRNSRNSNFMEPPYFALGKLDDEADFEPEENCYGRADFHINNPAHLETIAQEAQKRKHQPEQFEYSD